MLINRLAIIGVGLIGGSFALALKKSHQVGSVIGCGRTEKNLKIAQSLGIIDEYTLSIADAVKQADMVFLAVPMGALLGAFQQMQGNLLDSAIITDGGSVKRSAIQDCLDTHPALLKQFVPGHPIAGTENSGAEAAFDTLYQGKRVILTPTEEVSQDKVSLVKHLWESCGASVSFMDAKEHDLILAATSHLPHLLAFNLMETLNQHKSKENILDFAAGGFRDFTRIASSNPTMWRDICLSNSDAILSILSDYLRGIEALAECIKTGNQEKILDVFEQAKTTRDQYIDSHTREDNED